MKERVTLTIDKDLLKRVDATVNHETIKNRSHAVELLLRKTLRGSVPQTAVILAGGKNSVNGKQVLKAMVEINDKPILLHNIELLKRFGVQDIILAIGYRAKEVEEYFGNGSRFDVRISYVEEKEPLGTAGCLRLLQEQLTKPFIMLNGDELKNVDLEKLYDAHNQFEAMATIALTTTSDPTRFGVAMLDGNHIIRFVEKPNKEDAPSMLINAGLYILEPDVAHMVPEGYSRLEEVLFPVLAREGKLFGYPFAGQWFGIESASDLAKARAQWKSN